MAGKEMKIFVKVSSPNGDERTIRIDEISKLVWINEKQEGFVIMPPGCSDYQISWDEYVRLSKALMAYEE